MPGIANAQYTWNGGSSSSSNWSDAANWGGTAPLSGQNTTLTFAGSANLSPVQDIATPFALNSLTFAASAGNFNLSGGQLEFKSNSSGTAPVLNLLLATGVTATIQNDILLTNTLTISSGYTPSGNGGTLVLSGNLSGAGGLTTVLASGGTGNRLIILAGTNNTYSGATTIAEYAPLQINGTVNGNGDFNINNYGSLAVNGTLNGSGNVNYAANGYLYGSGTINRPINATGLLPITTSGAGLSLGSTFTGQGELTSGTLSVAGLLTVSTGIFHVDYGTSLTGAGAIAVNTTEALVVDGTSAATKAITLTGYSNGSGGGSTANLIGYGTINGPVSAYNASIYSATNNILTINNTLTFTGGASLSTTAAGSLTLNGLTRIMSGASFEAHQALNGTGGIQIDAGGTLNLGGNTGSGQLLTVSGGLSQYGGTTSTIAGSVALAGGTVYSYAGGGYGSTFAISGGVTSIGSASLTSGIIVSVAGLTEIKSGTLSVNSGTTLSGTGSLQIDAGATLSNAGTVSKSLVVRGTYASATTLAYGVSLQGGSLTSSGTLTVSGALDVNNASLATSFLQAGTASISGSTTVESLNTFNIVSGTALNGAGAAAVASGGSIIVNGTVGKVLTVQSGGQGNGSGTIKQLVLQSNGLFKPGNSPGTITIQSGVDDAGVVEIDIPTGTPGQVNMAGTSNGAVSVQSGNSTLRSGAGIQVKTDSVGAAFAATPYWSIPEIWRIWTNTSGQFVDANGVPTVTPNFAFTMVDVNGTPIPNYTNYGTYNTLIINSPLTASTIDLIWTPVPEPSTAAMLAAVGFSGAAWLRRRQYTFRSRFFQ